MQITQSALALIAGAPANANMQSVILGLHKLGASVGLNRAHRLAHYLAQIAHESGRFRHDKEAWGNPPSAAQARYDTRADLGNTAARDGDGLLFRGRTGIQVTGRANYRELTAWARTLDPSAPDFEAAPDALLTDPWEGIAPIWFWQTRSLNALADRNDIEMVTRRINGGATGLADRMALYTRSALVLLGRDPADVLGFQDDAGLLTDGIAGPKTRAALHARLTALVFALPEPPGVLTAAALVALLRPRTDLPADVAALLARVPA